MADSEAAVEVDEIHQNRAGGAGGKRSRGKGRANGSDSSRHNDSGKRAGDVQLKEEKVGSEGAATSQLPRASLSSSSSGASQPLSLDPTAHSSLIVSSSPSSLVATSVSVSSVLIAGAGFMCDAYDLFIMNVLLVVMGCEYAPDPAVPCKLSSGDESSLASAVVVGAVRRTTQHSTHRTARV